MGKKYNPCKIGFPIEMPKSNTLGKMPNEKETRFPVGLVFAIFIISALLILTLSCQKQTRTNQSLETFTLEDCAPSVQRNLAFFKGGKTRTLVIDEIFDLLECIDLFAPEIGRGLIGDAS